MPAPETFDGKPEKLRDWLFQVTLYFKAYHLDYEDSDAEYCGSLMASMLSGNALLWLRWYTVSNARTLHVASLTRLSPAPILQPVAAIPSAMGGGPMGKLSPYPKQH